MMQRPDLVGQQFGSYKLLRLLGAGGFAEVYLGEHIDLGTQAAIKVLHTQLSPTDIDAFRTMASSTSDQMMATSMPFMLEVLLVVCLLLF